MEAQGELLAAEPRVGDIAPGEPASRKSRSGDNRPSVDSADRSATRCAASQRQAHPLNCPLVIVVIAAASGISLDRYATPDLAFGHLWASATALLAAWYILWVTEREAAACWLLLGAVSFSTAGWHDLRWARFDVHEIGRFASFEDEPTCIEAIAKQAPDRLSAPQPTPLRAIPSGERSRLLIQVTAIRDRTQWPPASGVCQLTVDGHLLGVRPGDRLRIVGQLARPMPPLNPGEFDFAAHARADRQLARLRSSAPESVIVLERGSTFTFSGVLEAARIGAKRMVRQFVGPEQAGVAMAILLGDREGLPYDQTEPYLVTGTIHVLVVSGMNVAILAAGMLSFMRIGWMARRAGLAVIMVMVAGYALLTDLQPPVTRAAAIGILLCIAAWTGRRGVAFNSLAAAAIIVLALNPADLFRPGPQLSFLAVATLLWFGQLPGLRRPKVPDPLEQILATARPWYVRATRWLVRPLAWVIATSLAVWLTTLPLVLMNFHVGSPISVLVSPAVWLFVLAAMWSGFVMLTIGWPIPAIGALCGTVCGGSLAGLQHVVAWAEAVPGGHFWAPSPAWWWVLAFYVGLLAVMLWGRTIVPARWQLAALAAWILIGLVPPLARYLSRDGLACSFISVGHGTCVVLQAPTGETLVYDAGALASPEFATQSIASFLWHRGIRRIDGLVISHADVDHYNAVPGLLERFHIGAVYVSPVMFDGFGESTARGPQTLRQAIHQAGVPIREVWAGDRLRIGPDVRIDILHPPRRGVLGNDNANSVTLAVEYRGRRVLLPGDLESPGLDDVMAELPFDCDVLLAPHHGSQQSDPPGFAAWSTPEWVVISGGANIDQTDSATDTYRRASAIVLHTRQAGAVDFLLLPYETQVAAHCRAQH